MTDDATLGEADRRREDGAVDGPSSGDAPDAGSDEAPNAGSDAGSDAGRRSRVAVGVVAALVIVVLVVVAVAASRPAGYTDATRERFLRACTADGGPAVEDACRCTYDKLASTVPYDRFADVDQQLRQQKPAVPDGQPLSLPSDVEAVVASCRVAR